MKYCLKYTNLCKNLSKVDEIQIQYIEDRGSLIDEFYRLLKKDGVLECEHCRRIIYSQN